MWNVYLSQLTDFFSHDVWLLDAFGKAVVSKQFMFVACSLNFSLSKRLEFTLPNSFLANCPLSHCVSEDGEHFDIETPHIVWLRGRIAKLFGVQMPFSQDQYDVFQMSFVAINRSVTPFEIHPFAVIGGGIGDYGGCELDFKLSFAKSVSPDASKLIFFEFGELLTHDCTVREFCDYMSDGVTVYRICLKNESASITMQSGTQVLDEHGNFEEVFDDQIGFGYFDDRECQDCNGTGYEYIKYPISQTCESCNGIGRVNW